MNITVFDTETTSLDKPFCYNIGYVIINTDNWETLVKRSFVVEQVWHNLPLFVSAYYANKRPIYINDMKKRASVLDKYGYICQQMIRDFNAYNVERAFAYNAGFDEKVFNFNCDWYKCKNPFDNIPIVDIRGFVHNFLITTEYKQFCDNNGFYTETGNYSTTAEIVYRFIKQDTEFMEDHTALEDSEIEAEILRFCIEVGAVITENYPILRSVVKDTERILHIQDTEQIDYYFNYRKITINKDKTEIKLR